MAIYAVYTRPPTDRKAAEIVLVREGFCWPAFLFTALWALGRRLWLVAAALVAANVAAAVAVGSLGLNPGGEAVISLGLAVAVGVIAGDLRAWTLTGRGYVFSDMVAGDCLWQAERALLQSRPDITALLLTPLLAAEDSPPAVPRP